MKVSYDQRLNPISLLEVEVQNMMDELEDHLNAPSIEPEQDVGYQQVRYRHLAEPPRKSLSSESIVPDINFDGPYATYYVLEQTAIHVTPAVASQPNYYTATRPVLQAAAYVWMTDSGAPGVLTRLCIGYSTDNETTYVPLVNDSRPCGPTCGDSTPAFNGAQLHYWTGDIGYYAQNQTNDNPILLLASFGGDVKSAATTNITHVAVMADDNSYGDSTMKVVLFVWFREES